MLPLRRSIWQAHSSTLASATLSKRSNTSWKARGADVISPVHDIGRAADYDSPEEVAQQDLDAIERSDLVFALLDHLDSGTHFEVGYARKEGTPVIGYANDFEMGSETMIRGSGCKVYEICRLQSIMRSGGRMPESVLLLSGGLDSATLAYTHRPDLTVTVDYGSAVRMQRSKRQRKSPIELNLEHEVIEVDCENLGAGTMAGQQETDLGDAPEWWPYRNQLVVTLVAMKVVRRGADRLLVGAVADDQSHADGEAEFFELMDSLLSFKREISALWPRQSIEQLKSSYAK